MGVSLQSAIPQHSASKIQGAILESNGKPFLIIPSIEQKTMSVILSEHILPEAVNEAFIRSVLLAQRFSSLSITVSRIQYTELFAKILRSFFLFRRNWSLCLQILQRNGRVSVIIQLHLDLTCQFRYLKPVTGEENGNMRKNKTWIVVSGIYRN